MFTSETDTEVIPKLAHYIYHHAEEGENLSFSDVAERVVSQLVSYLVRDTEYTDHRLQCEHKQLNHRVFPNNIISTTLGRIHHSPVGDLIGS